jgi:uncharacterized membrane protein YhaH (DUF805 family)
VLEVALDLSRTTPVTRRTYLTVGLTLGAFKCAIDTLVVHAITGRWWTPLMALRPISIRAYDRVEPAWLFWALAIWTLGFLWIGLSMTARRVRDAGMSPWWALGFLVPFLNYLLIVVLCLVPSRPVHPATRVLPPLVRSQLSASLMGVGAGLLFAMVMLIVNVYALKSYGLALFLATPVVMGVLAGYVQNRGHLTSVASTFGTGALTALLGSSALLFLGLEGAVCILMSLPLAIVAAMLGSTLGRALALNTGMPTTHLGGLLLAIPLLSVLDAQPKSDPAYEVVSSVEIDAPPEVVWRNVVDFPALPAPEEWLFHTGIAFPTHATLEGTGVGALRRCEFNTGPFVEPITAWEPARRLSFDVTQSPPPMEEWSPYHDIRPPHLDGYFRSVRGEFRLVRLKGGRTRLEGSTWYLLRIAPVPYWRLIAEPILHTIHHRVLRHIRALAEEEARRGAA